MLLFSTLFVNLFYLHVSTPLTEAIEKCKWDDVEDLIHQKANVNEVNENLYSPLMFVCQFGFVHLSLVRLLIDNKADVNEVYGGEEHFTPLITAASNCRDDIVKVLIDSKADINATDNPNTSAVIELKTGVVSTRTTRVVTDKFGRTALFYAIVKGHYTTAMTLIELGAKTADTYEHIKKLGFDPFTKRLQFVQELADRLKNIINKHHESFSIFSQFAKDLPNDNTTPFDAAFMVVEKMKGVFSQPDVLTVTKLERTEIIVFESCCDNCDEFLPCSFHNREYSFRTRERYRETNVL
jgi:hypothetical protein